MKPFLHGKKEIGGAALRAPARASLPVASAAPAAHGHSAPNIEVVKEGEKIVRLVVTCGCGERMEVECLYRSC
jgi:hypothetical protein